MIHSSVLKIPEYSKISRLLEAALLLLIILFIGNSVKAEPLKLTVDEARDKALEFNRSYLSAKEEINKADGEVVKARAGALPTINANSLYTRNFNIPKMYFENDGETQSFQFGYKNSFQFGLTLQQSIFQGGKVFTAYSIAKDYKKYTQALLDQVKNEVIYQAEMLFYSALLERTQLLVLKKAFEANSYNLEVVEKQYSQGVVSEFEVLRARVEKNNLLPSILAIESNLRLSEKQLKSFIGIDLNLEIELIEQADDTAASNVPTMDALIQQALTQRPEVKQTDLLVDITRKAVKIYKANYYPSLVAFAAYDWQASSDQFSMSDNISKSASAGLSLSIPIFQGGGRSGDVGYRKADHRQALLTQMQLKDDIKLEVEGAYDRLMQAKKSLDIQGANIAEAEEGLRIANVRYKSGVGTQLEVLSAQVALTDARNAQAEAIFQFRQARAELKKTTSL